MFYPQEMAKISLIVHERDVLAVTRTLADQGIFHQIDVSSYGSSQPAIGSADHWHAQSAAYAALERRILTIMKGLGIEEEVYPTDASIEMIEVSVARPTVEMLEKETFGLIAELTDARKKLEQLERYVHQLEPVVGVDVDIHAFRDQRYIFAMLGIMPVDNLDRLQTSLERVPFVLLTLRREGEQAVVLLFGLRRNADVLERAARSAYLSPLNLPDEYRGTPEQIVSTLRENINSIRQHIAERQGTMAELREVYRERLHVLLWRVRAGRTLTDAMARFGRLHYTYLIMGWVPARRLESLAQELSRVSQDIVIESDIPKRSDSSDDVPVALDNPGILRAFQRLVTTYGRPRYAEIDPTVIVAITFPLLFGAMFGDVGHSFLLVLAGLLLVSRKVRVLRSLADMGKVITICGLAAMAFGFLYGSVFGVEDMLPALWLHPMEDIMHILMTTVLVGIVLLSLGFILGIANDIISRDWGKLLFGYSGISGAVLYWSLVGLGAEISTKNYVLPWPLLAAVATVSCLSVTFSEVLCRLMKGERPLIEGSVGTYIVQSLFELVDTLISILSNSLSYVRVGAFAVAHGGLSAVVFILASMFGGNGGVGYWSIVVLGNLFIVGFEGVIVGIQSLRLEYYEFFSKFFSGGGMRYKPLTLLPEKDG